MDFVAEILYHKSREHSTVCTAECSFFCSIRRSLNATAPCLVARLGAMANEIFHVRFSFVQGFCVPYCIVKKNNYFAFGFVGRFC